MGAGLFLLQVERVPSCPFPPRPKESIFPEEGVKARVCCLKTRGISMTPVEVKQRRRVRFAKGKSLFTFHMRSEWLYFPWAQTPFSGWPHGLWSCVQVGHNLQLQMWRRLLPVNNENMQDVNQEDQDGVPLDSLNVLTSNIADLKVAFRHHLILESSDWQVRTNRRTEEHHLHRVQWTER